MLEGLIRWEAQCPNACRAGKGGTLAALLEAELVSNLHFQVSSF